MILDPQVKMDLAQQWNSVRTLCRSRSYQLPGGPFINTAPSDELHNLPFILAYAVLDQTLSQLRDEGRFECKWWQIGKKMKASKDAIPWQKYDFVTKEVKDARDDLAHKAKLLAKPDCLRYIDAIEVELRAWGVL